MAYIAPTSYEELQEECNTQRFLKLEAYVMLMSGYANPPIMPLPEDFKWLVERIRVQDTLLDVYRCKQKAARDAVPVPPAPDEEGEQPSKWLTDDVDEASYGEDL